MKINLEKLKELPSDIKSHIDHLYQVAKGKKKIIEIGVRKGISTKALLAGIMEGNGKLLSRDEANYYEVIEEAFRPQWTFVQGKSQEVMLPEEWHSGIDILFIDGNHKIADKDFLKFEKYVRHGGKILLHDINMELDSGIPICEFVKSLDMEKYKVAFYGGSFGLVEITKFFSKKEIEEKLQSLGRSDPLPIKLPHGIEFNNYHEEYRYPKFTHLNDAGSFDGFSPPAKILDLGFGSGFFSIYYVQRGFEVTAVNIDKKQIKRLEYIKELFSFDTLTIVNADITTSFDFKDFDLILLLGVIHHLDQNTHLKLLQNCYNALRKNGAIVIETKGHIPSQRLLKDAGFLARQMKPKKGRPTWRGDKIG